YCHRNLAIVAAIHERRPLGFPEYSLAIVESRSVRRNQTEKRRTGMKTWFITGASRGFGALIAKRVLEVGEHLVATARNPQTIVDSLGSHPNLLALPLDVTNGPQAHEAAAAAVKRFGRIDVLLNNAGFGLLGAVEEATSEEVEQLYRTNVFGLLIVIRAVLPPTRPQRCGHVFSVASTGGDKR